METSSLKIDILHKTDSISEKLLLSSYTDIKDKSVHKMSVRTRETYQWRQRTTDPEGNLGKHPE